VTRHLGGPLGSVSAADLKEATPGRQPPDGSPGRPGRLPVSRRELACVVAITVAAAVLRFAHVATGGPWDSDQGTELLALWTAMTTGQLPLFGPAATSLGSTFHHGALYYDLLMPAVWISHGDPRAVLAEIAAVNTLAVPMLWWVARSIGGRATGLIVALMAATSADLVFFSTFIWNPTFIETGAALGVLGAWEAWRSRNPRWWLAGAAGVTLAAQAHVAAAVLAIPLALVFLLDVSRSKAPSRRRTLLWGLGAAALIVASYLPVIYHELTGGFSELRGIASYVSSPPGYVEVSPVARLVFAAIRIPAWPLTGWPYYELRPGLMLALTVFLALVVAWSLMALRTWRHHLTISGSEIPDLDERHGVAFLIGGLGLIVLVLGLGLRAVSELNVTMSEQYHTAADPFVLVATGVTIGAVWNAGRADAAAAAGRYAGMTRRVRRAAVVMVVAAFVGFNAAHWPPVTTAGSWIDAQAAATRIERDAAGGRIALVALYATKGTDAYAYPLLRDGIGLAVPQDASTVVLLCDTAWIKTGCGGYEEMDWLRYASEGRGLALIDYFYAAPDKIMSVYRRVP
jgi:4-amino-4-deoxy-L-arabinose transferase-like glycosyltransferase